MSAPKPLRADAQRNRDRLVEAAVRAFTASADVTLESIAKDAGVGIGTLYRHFPTREALIEAAYRNELTKLCDAAPELLRVKPADEALRSWLSAFVDYMATKHGMGDALKAVIASGGNPFEHSRARLSQAMSTLLEAAVAQGTVRGDVPAWDVVVSASGVSLTSASGDPAQAGRLLDLLMDGLRFRAGR
ncbi:TetR/AcrR family transcriptional regulator [Actinocrispum sp. NPDC049592]|uniref:TetR/AcrR family transcriptional regulator n=1 Tax=Actinocrispum sp. NPDC049592 TaxID=3154835 RepID=UPI003418EC62